MKPLRTAAFRLRPSARVILAAVALSAAWPSARAAVAETGATTPGAKRLVMPLGSVTFANSGPASVQEDFLQGLAALHSFWYEEAVERFQATTKADPTFAMGYWGEALANNHSLWNRQDQAYARQVLAKIGDTSKLTPRERAYIEAAHLLYGEGDKLARDRAYEQALAKIEADYPDDLDAAAFHALSILGTVRPGEQQNYDRQLRAAAIAEGVARRNPLHPGATHYIIHAYDHPDYAQRGLDAARHYAQIAPAAFHAQHMPAHIFVQLGMWEESARSNTKAWNDSDEWVQRKQLDLGLRDYHSYHWLVYTRLQEGRYREAKQLVDQLGRIIAANGPSSVNFYDQISAIYVVETGEWAQADELYGRRESAGPVKIEQTASELCGGRAPLRRDSSQNNTELPVAIRAYAATAAGVPEAGRLRDAARAVSVDNAEAYDQKVWQIRLLQIEALRDASRQDFTIALEKLAQASDLEAKTAKPSGPPRLIKPSHELYGEILLQAGRPQDAVKQFEVALSRQPGRAHSLLGLARAKAQSGDVEGAKVAAAAFLEKWKAADADRPELAEAKGYLNPPAKVAVR